MKQQLPIRIAFVLPGLHRVNRGAEAAFEALGRELAAYPDMDVTLVGSGEERPDAPYAFQQFQCTPREKFRTRPTFPVLRNEYRYEELSFVKSWWRSYDPLAFDVVLTCSFPFVQWSLLTKKRRGRRPEVIFVTENGDWPVQRKNMEYRLFGCEGLVCTNPEYYNRHNKTYDSALIPNGIDVDAFTPVDPVQPIPELPDGTPLFLMVSALISSKYPMEGIRAVARIPGAGLVIAGNGPLHEECDALGQQLMGDRYKRITLPLERMPDLYRSADVLLHLSRAEAFGNIYIEAAACGLPVVAHDTENTRWILGEAGIFADTGNQDELHKALLRGADIRAKLDRDAQCRQIAERFSWATVAEQYHGFIKHIAER